MIQRFSFCAADGVMDVKEECAKFGVVRSCKFDGDSTAGYKVIWSVFNCYNYLLRRKWLVNDKRYRGGIGYVRLSGSHRWSVCGFPWHKTTRKIMPAPF